MLLRLILCLAVVLWTGNIYTLGDAPSNPADNAQEVVLTDPLDSNFYGIDDDDSDGPEQAGRFIINVLGVMFGDRPPSMSPFHIRPQTEAGQAIEDADDTEAELQDNSDEDDTDEEDDDDDDEETDGDQTGRLDSNSVHNRTTGRRRHHGRHHGGRHHGRRGHHGHHGGRRYRHRHHHRRGQEDMATSLQTICTNAQNAQQIPEHMRNVIQTLGPEAQAEAQRRFEQMRNHVRNCCSRNPSERMQCLVNTMQERVTRVCTGQERLPPWRISVERQMEIRNSCCSLEGRQRFGCFRNIMITQHRTHMEGSNVGMVNNTCARLQRPMPTHRRFNRMNSTWRAVWAQKRQALQRCCQQTGAPAIVNCFVQVRREKFNRFCSNQEQLKPWKFPADVQGELRQNCCSKEGDDRYNCIHEAKTKCHRRRHAGISAEHKLQGVCRKVQRPALPRRRITQHMSAEDIAKWQAIWTGRRNEIRECCQIDSVEDRSECVSDIRNSRLDSVCDGEEELFPQGRHSGIRRRRITARLTRCCALEDDARHDCFYRSFSNNRENGSVNPATLVGDQTPGRGGSERRHNPARRQIVRSCCEAGKQAGRSVNNRRWMTCRRQAIEHAKPVTEYKMACKRLYRKCCFKHSRRTSSNISPTTTSP